MKDARLILTRNCNKNCSYCINKDPDIKSEIELIDDTDVLKNYRDIIITGGEPQLVEKSYPKFFQRLVVLLYIQGRINNRKIYLYTASWFPFTHEILSMIDGMTYTIHDSFKDTDHSRFLHLQLDLCTLENKSFYSRLNINPNTEKILQITPTSWDEIKLKYMDDFGECETPPNEDLFEATPEFLQKITDWKLDKLER